MNYSKIHQYAYVYFISGSVTMTHPRSVVRVRFPLSAVRQQAGLDDEFFQRVDEYVEAAGRPIPWAPTLEELDGVPQSSTAQIEGTVMSLSQYGEAGVCDIYSIPADFVMRIHRRLSWDVDTSLRVTMPTVVVHTLLKQMKSILDEEGTDNE